MEEQVQVGLTDEMLALEAEVNKWADAERKTFCGLVKYIRDHENLRNFVTIQTTQLNPLLQAQPASEARQIGRVLVHLLLTARWAFGVNGRPSGYQV